MDPANTPTIDEIKKKKRREKNKLWYEKNKEKHKETMRERYADNREELNEMAKQKARERNAKISGRKPGRPLKKVIPPTTYVDDVGDVNITTIVSSEHTVPNKTDSIEDMVKELDKISSLRQNIEDIKMLLKSKEMELESLLNTPPANDV